MTPTIRAATRADLEQFCDGRLGPSVKGVVAELDGKLVGAAGLAFKGGVVMAFCDVTEEMKQFKTLLHRGASRFLRGALKTHPFIYAQINCDEPTARRWLSRLGFREVDDEHGIWLLSEFV